MSTSISTYLDIDPNEFAATGAFDAVLDVDSKLFIDPHLLKSTKAAELSASYEKVTQRFADVLKLLSISKHSGDAAWRNAYRLFMFPEVKGLCIGYSAHSTSGSGMGAELRTQLLITAKTIVDAGINDPEIFELMWLFEEGIGADRVSDMTARIILEDLMMYSQRIFSAFNVKSLREISSNNVIYHLPVNSHNKWPIILIPQDILRDLPVAHGFADIDTVVGFNQKLRQRLNELIGVTWREASKLRKSDYKRAVLGEPEILQELVQAYRKLPAKTYDFEKDPAGQIAWYNASRRITDQYPLDLHLAPNPTSEDVMNVVLKICEQFKQLIENNGLHTLLYRDDGCADPKREEAAQKLFYGVADSYCKANNLDLSPETNAGRGAVDFKLSRGYRNRVLVETKLTTNPHLVHGFEVQLDEYQKAEKTSFAVYLVIHVGGSELRLKQLDQAIEKAKASDSRVPEVVHVYGKRKPSASRYRRR